MNRLTYSTAGAARSMFAKEVDAASQVMDVARRRPDSPPPPPPPPTATLLPISPAILPRPTDWPPTVHLTGPWSRSADSTDNGIPTDAELTAFADRGPFVYAGFGSMAMGDATARGRAVVEAVRDRGERLLVATGLGGIDVPEELRGHDVLVRRSIDHAAVLPGASAVIHHGGIGTVHAAVRAGAVSIVVPFIADQPFWGALLHRRRLGPAPIRQSRLTATRLAAALAEVPAHRERLAAASTLMGKEDGTLAAVRVLESVV